MKFYSVPWSLHCQKAEELLMEAKVPIVKVELSERAVFDATPRDLGFHRLPVLSDENVYYEGLKEISAFTLEWKNNNHK